MDHIIGVFCAAWVSLFSLHPFSFFSSSAGPFISYSSGLPSHVGSLRPSCPWPWAAADISDFDDLSIFYVKAGPLFSLGAHMPQARAINSTPAIPVDWCLKNSISASGDASATLWIMHAMHHTGPRTSGWEIGELSFDFIILLLDPSVFSCQAFQRGQDNKVFWDKQEGRASLETDRSVQRRKRGSPPHRHTDPGGILALCCLWGPR